MRSILPTSLGLCLVFTANAVAQGRLWVVSPRPGPGVDFTQVKDAVAAAQGGDRVLVKPGTYDFFTIDGKGVDVVADESGDVGVTEFVGGSAIHVRNVPAGHSVTLRGLTISGPPAVYPDMIDLERNAGSIWLEDCATYGIPAVGLEDCASVTITRCTFLGTSYGGDPGLTPGPPHPAVVAVRSNVWVFDSHLTGGSGGSGFHPVLGDYVYDGAPAVRLEDGAALVSGSTLQGGAGGKGISDGVTCMVPPGDGAAAISVGPAPALVHLAGGSLWGGAAGTPAVGCPPGNAAGPIDSAGGTVHSHLGVPASLTVPSAAREGESPAMAVGGAAGDQAFLLLSPLQGGELLPPHTGALVVGASPLLLVPLGAIPVGGTVGFAPAVGELGPGVQGVMLFMQAVTCPPAIPCLLGTPSAILALDAAL